MKLIDDGTGEELLLFNVKKTRVKIPEGVDRVVNTATGEAVTIKKVIPYPPNK